MVFPGQCQAVHPRVCGEHAAGDISPDRLNGSSPRLRGTQNHIPEADIFYRFIPASAGNTSLSVAGANAGAVHPRVCGEHTSSISLIFHLIFKEQKSTNISQLKITLNPNPDFRSQAEMIPALIHPFPPEYAGLHRESGNQNPIRCWYSRP